MTLRLQDDYQKDMFLSITKEKLTMFKAEAFFALCAMNRENREPSHSGDEII